MSDETDLIKLYSARILALAADIPHLGRMEDGHLAEMKQDVKACALGQAAAAVVGAAAPGSTSAQVTRARDQLRAMLKGEGPAPEAPFDGLEVLTPAAAYKNRHASIMLSLEALNEAMQQAEAPAGISEL